MTEEKNNLIYSSKYTNGNAYKGDKRGAGGGEFKLYDDSTVIYTSYFADMGPGHEKPEYETKEKKFEISIVNQIIELIKSSGIMKKECPSGQNFDVVKWYTINLDGEERKFKDPLGECGEVIDKIEKLIRENFNEKFIPEEDISVIKKNKDNDPTKVIEEYFKK